MKMTVARLVEGRQNPEARYVAFEVIFDREGWPVENFLQISSELYDSLEVGQEVEVPDSCLRR